MRSFLTANDRFFKTVQILNGPKTRAVIQPADDKPFFNDQFLTPKQMMKVRPDSLIQPGQVIVYNDQHFLVGDMGSTTEWKSYALFHCDRQVDWQRPATTTDPTTGLEKAGGPPSTIDQLWVYWERVLRAPYDSVTRVPNIDYIVATGASVLRDDLITGKNIVRYDQALGLLILGLKE